MDTSLEPSNPVPLRPLQEQSGFRKIHKCHGRLHEEVDLTANISDSVTVESATSMPQKICTLCGERVHNTGIFRCFCGEDDDGMRRIIQCTRCSTWQHIDCAPLRPDKDSFVCNYCVRSSNLTAHPTHTFIPDSTPCMPAIHFSADDDQPRLITVPCLPPTDLSSGSRPTPLLQTWFPDGRYTSLTVTQGLNQKPLRFPLQMWYDSDALSRGSPVNRAIYRITSGKAPRVWSGNVVVLKFSGSRCQGYTDASLNDLPALSAYFLGFK